MALDIVITSTAETSGFIYTKRWVYFTANLHWSAWTFKRVYINGNIWSASNVVWTLGWNPEEPSQRVTISGLTQGQTYTIQIAGYETSDWEYGNIVQFTMPAPSLPSKAINPAPSNAATNVVLGQETLSWDNGGGATSYDIYYGEDEEGLTLVSEGQADTSFTIWEIDYGSPFDYAVSRTWRIDAINEYGTTIGDTWTFTTIKRAPPSPVYYYEGYWYQLLYKEGTTLGSPPPGGTENIDYKKVDGPANYTQRLYAISANNEFWYEI